MDRLGGPDRESNALIEGIELELSVLLVTVILGAEVFAPFEVHTPVWRKLVKWGTVCGVTLGMTRLIGHGAAWIPVGCALAGLAVHFAWCRRHGIHPLRATPRRRYFELRGWPSDDDVD